MRAAMTMSIVAALMVGATACGSSEPAPPPEYPPVEEPAPVTTAQPEEPPAEPEPPPPPPVQVVAGERMPLEGDAPSIRIRGIRDGRTIRRGDVRFRVQVRNWELAPAPGKHVHLIIDNEPYIAMRDLSGNLNLNEILQENGRGELEEGSHVIRMFPSRSHHESVKEGTPFAMAYFHFREETDGWEIDPEAPLLTYSRPKGCNPAGERILLDFYVSNAELGAPAEGEEAEEGEEEEEAGGPYRVGYRIDGQTRGQITEWAPHYIENLQPGEHTVQLVLLDSAGQPVPGPFNDTTRTITVAEQCPGAAADEEAEEEGEGEGEEGEDDE